MWPHETGAMVVQAFGGMFCISGLLGIYGSCATLAGYCMSRHFGIAGVNVFKLKVRMLQINQLDILGK